MAAAKMHRRKSSREEDENLVMQPNGDLPQPLPVSSSPDLHQSNGHKGTLAPAPPSPATRPQVTSSPSPLPLPTSLLSPSSTPPSAGPYRTGFGAAATAPRVPSGSNGHPSSPFRSTINGHNRAHSRAGSISGSFAPPLPSPLSGSFPTSVSHSHVRAPSYSSDSLLHTSASNPESLSNGLPSNAANSRRHSRLHSRNLSIFFPRPGSLPESSIAEDGTQEIEMALDEEAAVDISTPRTAEHQKKLQGFSFGGRPPSSSFDRSSSNHSLDSQISSTSRRGHHHKHSMSHQFFSFLDPGSQIQGELLTQPTPTPVSSWNPISPFPEPPKTNGHSHSHGDHEHDHEHDHSHSSVAVNGNGIFHYTPPPSNRVPRGPFVAMILQFILGAYIWVTGQQIGSLSCTGLGYWVVFDAFGVGVGGGVLSGYLGLDKEGKPKGVKRAYGNARVETVVMFAQSVYLMFASVYVCKETVEHLLLTAGGEGEGHHHHHGDEEVTTLGIQFPLFLVFVTLVSLVSTALYFNNHAKLVDTTGNHIPPIRSVIRDSFSRYPSQSLNGFRAAPTSSAEVILTNPFVLSPILFCVAILGAAGFLPLEHYRTFDLALAGIETVVTFNVAYRASAVLGTVLLQTSPERGLAGGQMEAFLRAMKEIERHPQVLHLPAPHIWQLTPSLTDVPAQSHTSKSASQSLVVTMELHVRYDLGDDDVLQLTQWAWERCVNALHFGSGRGGKDREKAAAEVTVGVVRG